LSSTCTVAVVSSSAYTSINAAMPPVLMLEEEVVSLLQPSAERPTKHSNAKPVRLNMDLPRDKEVSGLKLRRPR